MRRVNGQILTLWLAMATWAGCDSASPAEPATGEAEHEQHQLPPPDPHAEHANAPAEAPAAAPAADPAAAMPAIPEGAKVAFIDPQANASVKGPLKDGKVEVKVKMGAEGIEVKPAGEVVPNSGHHHLLLDAEPAAAGQVVPKDDTHLHFGKGETETTVALTPGSHTLTLQFADGIHRAYGPQLSASIEIEVAAE